MGTEVSDKFVLLPECYQVDATVGAVGNFTGFAVHLHGPGSLVELLFNEVIEGAGLWEGSTTVTIPEDGEYFVEASNTNAAWMVQLAPF